MTKIIETVKHTFQQENEANSYLMKVREKEIMLVSYNYKTNVYANKVTSIEDIFLALTNPNSV